MGYDNEESGKRIKKKYLKAIKLLALMIALEPKRKGKLP